MADKFTDDSKAFNGIPKDYHFSIYGSNVGDDSGYMAIFYLDNGLNLRVVDDNGSSHVDDLDDVDILLDKPVGLDNIMDLFRSASP